MLEEQFLSPKPKTFATREARIASQLAERYIKKGKIPSDVLYTDKAIEEYIKTNGLVKDNSISIADIIKELHISGAIPKVRNLKEETKKIKKEPEFIPIRIPEARGLHIVNDEGLEENLSSFRKTIKKDTLVEDSLELDAVYAETLALEKNRDEETEAYYYEFTKIGYSSAEIKKNLEELHQREEAWKGEQSPETMKNKKIATVTEVALEYAVSELSWYGDKVKIQPTSKFDDVKRRVDDVLEIRTSASESSFMGLGIDVTYRGLHSEQYKNKTFTLLQSIKDGYKTKVKYFKQSDGTPMKEFAIPKAILYFNFGDVKNLVYMLKNIQDPKIKEEFKNHPQKFAVMNQIITQCEKLSAFAKKYNNTISEEYEKILRSINGLAAENPEIKTMIAVRHEDKTSRHLEELMREFEAQ